jgi:hypothetical protein
MYSSPLLSSSPFTRHWQTKEIIKPLPNEHSSDIIATLKHPIEISRLHTTTDVQTMKTSL